MLRTGAAKSRSSVGFETPLPISRIAHFFVTSEADFEWNAVVHLGGPPGASTQHACVRRGSRGKQISRAGIDYASRRPDSTQRAEPWPPAIWNPPALPLVTEKAFSMKNEVDREAWHPHRNISCAAFRVRAVSVLAGQVEVTIPVQTLNSVWQLATGPSALVAGVPICRLLLSSAVEDHDGECGRGDDVPVRQRNAADWAVALKVIEPRCCTCSGCRAGTAFVHAQLGAR
jgi:hypothetical protein